MNGLIYRMATAIKETGEQLRSRVLIVLGLAIRGLILDIKITWRKK